MKQAIQNEYDAQVPVRRSRTESEMPEIKAPQVLVTESGEWVAAGRRVNMSAGIRIGKSPATLGDLRDALARARERTMRADLGTRVKSGLVQVVRVTYDDRGRSSVDALSDFLSPAAAIAFLSGVR